MTAAQTLVDFVFRYGDFMTDNEWKIFHCVLNRIELQADNERQKLQESTKGGCQFSVAVL